MSLNQSFISDFSEYYRWSQRTKIKYKLHYGWYTVKMSCAKEPQSDSMDEQHPNHHLRTAGTRSSSEVDGKGNYQEPNQSNSTSCPRNQTGKEQTI